MEHANPLDFDPYTGLVGYFALARQLSREHGDPEELDQALNACMNILVWWHGGIVARELPRHGYRLNRTWAGRRVN